MGPGIVDTIGVLIILSFFWFLGAVMEGRIKTTPFPNPPPEEKFGVISFSPDSQKLYLEFADLAGKVRIGWMDLSSRKVSLFQPQDTQDQLSAASSSADGNQLAIVIKEAAHNFDSSQIGILDLQNMTYHAITHGYAYRQFPSFSRDGKKIIYAKAILVIKDGHQIAIGWDIEETDINTGIERQLTHYCFHGITPPFYIGDGDKFVFSGDDPFCNYPSPGRNDYKSYFEKYHENEIFMRSTGKEAPLEPLFQNSKFSNDAFVTSDNNIFFVSTTEDYNYDIFSYNNGVIKQLTNFKTYLAGIVVSPHGDLIEYGRDEKRNKHTKQWLMNVKSGTHNEIDFGDSKSFQIIKVANHQTPDLNKVNY